VSVGTLHSKAHRLGCLVFRVDALLASLELGERFRLVVEREGEDDEEEECEEDDDEEAEEELEEEEDDEDEDEESSSDELDLMCFPYFRLRARNSLLSFS